MTGVRSIFNRSYFNQMKFPMFRIDYRHNLYMDFPK